MSNLKKISKRNRKLNKVQSRLVDENIALAYSRTNNSYGAYRNSNTLLDKDDFCSYALEGLCEAALRFDETRNVKFSTFAVSYIDNYIRNNVYKESPTIALPFSSTSKEKRDYYKHLALNNSLFIKSKMKNITIDGVLCEVDVLDIIGGEEDGFGKIDDSLYIKTFTNILSEEEQYIFKEHIIKGKTLKYTSTHLGIHINTVSRKKKNIINKIVKEFDKISKKNADV